MYGLPEDLDLSPLVGAVLQTVVFGKYNVFLHFYRGLVPARLSMLHVMSSLRVFSSEGAGEFVDQQNA
jgi:hypothetical protein